MSEEKAVEVEALTSFAHGSERRSGERFLVSKQHADALVRGGLVQVVETEAQAEAAAHAAAADEGAAPVGRKPRKTSAAE